VLPGHIIFVIEPGSRESELPVSLKDPLKLLQPVEPKSFPSSLKFKVGSFSNSSPVFKTFPCIEEAFHSLLVR
jgi:hypothetical protein